MFSCNVFALIVMPHLRIVRMQGPDTGLSHSMMVSNLVRSVHLYSQQPIIVYAVGGCKISTDWDPSMFPRLIVIHADSIDVMTPRADNGTLLIVTSELTTTKLFKLSYC